MPSRPKKESTFPRISVVIAGHNRPFSLRETIVALKNQTLPMREFEVIVVGYTNTSLQSVCDEFKSKMPNLSYVEIDSRWPDKKRNKGITIAKAKIIAFTDDDVLPQKDWLKKILERFTRQPEIVGVEGYTYGDNTPLLSHATKNEKGGEYPTCNLAFKKEVFKKINGFDEEYHFFREDTDIAYRAKKEGEIVFDPLVKVFHPTRMIQAKSILNELGMTRGEIRLYKKFPETYAHHYFQKWPRIPGRGGWLQAALAYLHLIGVFFFIFFIPFPINLIGIAGVIFIAWCGRYIISFKKRTGSWKDKLLVFTYMLVRDLAYPFFFGYFWVTENPLPCENRSK